MGHFLLASIRPMLVPLALVCFSSPALAVTPMLQADQQESDQETDQESDKEDETKSYADVITDEAVTSEGLFDTHMIGDDLYFEIPLEMMEREMLRPLHRRVLVLVQPGTGVSVVSLQVVAGGEGHFALSANHEAPDLALVGHSVDGANETGVNLRVQRVALFWPIDGKGGYVTLLFNEKVVIAHVLLRL